MIPLLKEVIVRRQGFAEPIGRQSQRTSPRRMYNRANRNKQGNNYKRETQVVSPGVG